MADANNNAANGAAAAPRSRSEGADGQVHRSAALYVGDLHPSVTEADLFEIFNAVASVASVRVCRHAISRQSLGYAYVNFHTITDAEKVLDTMNYTQIKGRMSRLMWSQRDPSFRRAGNGNVFVKNLDPKIDSKDLNDTFSVFGNIISCKVVTDPVGNSRGYGFVHFEREEEALEAIEKVNGTVIHDRPVFVGKFEPAERRHKKQQWTNLFVKNIPTTWTEEKLSELFAQHGEIASITIVKNADGEGHKGFGFVDFKEHDSAVAAQGALNAKVIEGEFKQIKNQDEPVPLKLYVGRFQKKRERQRLLQERRQAVKQQRIRDFLGKNLYVRNLAEECTDDMLRKEFSAHGTITSAKVMKNPNGNSRGFGFVCFATQEEANKAHKAQQGVLFMNKPLHIAMWQPREERQQFLRRLHESRVPNGGRQMHGPGGLMPMMPVHMMPAWVPRAMYRGGMPQGGRGNAQFFQQYGGRGNMVGRGRGGRGRGRGGRDVQQMQYAMQQQIALEQQQQQQQAAMLAQQQAQMAQQAQAAPAGAPPVQQAAPSELTATHLAHSSPEEQKNLIGEKLYPQVMSQLEAKGEPAERAGKVTGMLLDGVETTDLLHLLESPEALAGKVEEALRVLVESAAPSSAPN